MIKPKKFQKGDRVAIVSLSSGILGEPKCGHQIDIGVKRLKKMGLTPVFMPNALKGIEFLKNNPNARAEDLKSAFSDSSIKGIICSIGGDDTYRTIPYLMNDDNFKKNVINNPKIFIGFSDSTNNHFMFYKLGLVTYYGLNFLSDICELGNGMLPYTKKSYERFFRNDNTFFIESSDVWYENRSDYSKKSIGTDCIQHNENKHYEGINGKGKISGLFFGGCLESIYDMHVSERYSDQRSIFDKYELIPKSDFYGDKLVFLETSEEKISPEKFKKIMNYFIDNDIIVNSKALIIGKPYDEVHYQEYKSILENLSLRLNIPILFNVNVGHALPRAMIPYGVNGEIDFDNKTLRMIDKIFSND